MRIICILVSIITLVAQFGGSYGGEGHPLHQIITTIGERIKAAHIRRVSSIVNSNNKVEPETTTTEVAYPAEAGVVNTKSGRVRGELLSSRGGEKYYAYKGIPFAEKPERFELAEPVKPWSGIRDAVNASSVCAQVDPFSGAFLKGESVVGDEDCLYLNVYTPHEERCKHLEKLPVLVHMHGGAFTSGSGDMYDPFMLMDECIVYVSNNYRLGALGFLSTGDEVIPGNLGLKDSLLALKWTNDNVEAFRGDKESITLTGISAGGIIVSQFMAAPAAKGLFHRVIAQSGSALCPILFNSSKAGEYAFRLGQQLNCTSTSSSELKECLKTKGAFELAVATEKVRDWIVDFARFGPVIEPKESSEPFITEDTYKSIRRGKGSRVPLITGIAGEEGILLNAFAIMATPGAVGDLNKNWDSVTPKIFFYDHLPQGKQKEVSDRIKEFYFGGKDVGPETAQGLTQAQGDRFFHYPSYLEAKLHSNYAPTYHYAVTYAGNYSLVSKLLGLPDVVVSHGHDARLVYRTRENVPVPTEGVDLEFSQKLIKLLVSFINSGAPTDVFPDVDVWKPFTSARPSTLVLDLPSENVAGFRKERMEFWDSLKLNDYEL